MSQITHQYTIRDTYLAQLGVRAGGDAQVDMNGAQVTKRGHCLRRKRTPSAGDEKASTTSKFITNSTIHSTSLGIPAKSAHIFGEMGR